MRSLRGSSTTVRSCRLLEEHLVTAVSARTALRLTIFCWCLRPSIVSFGLLICSDAQSAEQNLTIVADHEWATEVGSFWAGTALVAIALVMAVSFGKSTRR